MPAEFLSKHGYELLAPISGDVSPRRYARVQNGKRTAVLMDCTHELPGRPGMIDFIKIAKFLREANIHVPEIYETNEAEKCLILEDFGDVSFGDAIKAGENRRSLYVLASTVLKQLRDLDVPSDLNLPSYYDTRVHALHNDVVRWWLPHGVGVPATDDVLSAYHGAWQKIERALRSTRQGFVHMDYHLENLMFMPDKSGILRCGLIDFQDASIGSGAYDLANLLLDARVSVPEEIQAARLQGFDADFMASYRVLSTQFHCRVIGLFTKLAVQDGRDEYAAHIPRLASYIADAMRDPLLEPLRVFFSDLGVDFTRINRLNVA